MPILKNTVQKHLPSGFTLIEISLTVALIVILAGFSLPIIREFIQKNDLEITSNIIAQNLRRAQTLAMASKYDNRWGVAIENGFVTIYSLDATNTRVPEYDENYSIPTSVNLSGLSDIQFNKFSGEPTTAGTISISNLNENETKNITINEKGLVSF